MNLTWIGHAGFIVEAAGKRILIDPWFNPAFLGTWRPQPDNSHLADWVAGQSYDYICISHGHEDHCDKAFLKRLSAPTHVFCESWLEGDLKAIRAFSEARYADCDNEKGRFILTYADDYRQDSMLLIEADGERVLFANDCNLDRCEWPKRIDVLACQYSGAAYYPTAYDYPPDVMAMKVQEARARQMDMLVAKVRACGAKKLIPCAGPAKIEGVADGPGTPFPFWDEVAEEFAFRCADVEVIVPQLPPVEMETRQHGNTTFTGPKWVFDRIDAGACSFEEALLSMKLKLHREPDVYDRVVMERLRGRDI